MMFYISLSLFCTGYDAKSPKSELTEKYLTIKFVKPKTPKIPKIPKNRDGFLKQVSLTYH